MIRYIDEIIQNPKLINDDSSHFQLYETHISWVLVGEKYAYKIKKPVVFDFVDYSNKNNRKTYCLKEIFLSQKYCCELDAKILSIFFSKQGIFIKDGAESNADDYLIKMIKFDNNKLLSNFIKTNTKESLEKHFFEFGVQIAKIHLQQKPIAFDSKWFIQNEQNIFKNLDRKVNNLLSSAIKNYTLSNYKKLLPIFISRMHDGMIRNCHGDLHFNNIILNNNHLCAFDPIEFNDSFSEIDVINDIAYFLMECDYNNLSQLGNSFLNSYLSTTLDYKGVRVLDFYKTYRAMIKHKVFTIQEKYIEADKYLKLAYSYSLKRPTCRIFLMYGVSRSGKTTTAYKLAKKYNAIVLSSDNFRIKLPKKIRYHSATTLQLYKKLLDITKFLIKSGFNVVVDATFLKKELRSVFVEYADKNLVTLNFIRPQNDIHFNYYIDNSEADEKVVASQKKFFEKLDEKEEELVLDNW